MTRAKCNNDTKYLPAMRRIFLFSQVIDDRSATREWTASSPRTRRRECHRIGARCSAKGFYHFLTMHHGMFLFRRVLRRIFVTEEIPLVSDRRRHTRAREGKRKKERCVGPSAHSRRSRPNENRKKRNEREERGER